MTELDPKKKSDILLLTTVSCHQNSIGSIFIRDILVRTPDCKIRWHIEQPFLLKTKQKSRNFLLDTISSVLVRIGPWQELRFFLFRLLMLQRRLRRIETEIQFSQSSIIWITASSPELICIAAGLATRGHDVRVTVWDDPEYLAQNLRFSKYSKRIVQKKFKSLLTNATACSVISEQMKQLYAAHAPKLPLVIMRHGIAASQRSKSNATIGPVNVIFVGSLYAKREWNAFVAALETVNWEVAGRTIQLVFVGRFPKLGAVRPSGLVCHEPMAQEEVMNLMSEMDIGYLPYWLEPSKELIASTSFPGKLTAYSAAGLSVFHHGPKNSSVTQFLQLHPYGVACDSFDVASVIHHLESLIRKLGSPANTQARNTAMEQALSDTVMIDSFRKLVGRKDNCDRRLSM